MYNIEKLEEFENAPTHLSRAQYITDKYGDMWDLRRFDHPWYRSDKNDTYWFKLGKILKKFLGKSVDKAYSEYCKLVRFEEKEYFWKELEGTRWRGADYLIDSNKNIQLNPDRYKRPKKLIVFRSFDYERGYYNRISKKTISLKDIYFESVGRGRWGWSESYYIDNPNYIEVVVSGFEKTFESKKDPEFIRLMAEKKKLIKLNNKLLKKLAKEKKYSFMSEKEKAKRANELDIQKRDSHGFDEESFRGIEYHGQKRKNLK